MKENNSINKNSVDRLTTKQIKQIIPAEESISDLEDRSKEINTKQNRQKKLKSREIKFHLAKF